MAEEEDYSSLPITERLVHKLWKVRVSACEDLTKIFKTSPKESPEFSNYTSFFKKMVSDSNLPAQIAALGSLQAYLENAPEDIATKTRGTVVPVICEKVLSSTRTDARIKGMEILLLYMEIDVPDPVIEKILPQINHRTPKVVSANVSALKEAIECYGTKNVNIAPILKAIPKIFAHSDKKVREEGFNLVTEIYEWIGPGIESFLEPLKPIQVKELHEKFEKCKNVGKRTQKRLLRSQQEVQEQEMDIDMADGDDMDDDEMDDEPIDLYDIQDPVNVLSKIPKGFYDTIKSTKWKERKAALEELSAVLSPPKYEDGKYNELVSTLAKRISDPNILCVTLSANCIEKIAKGLRNSFSNYKNIVMEPLLEKLKEKKQSVIEALSNALDAVYICCTIPDITEVIVDKMKNKNPNVKSESIKWLIRCLKTGKSIPQREQIKLLSEGLLKALTDSNSVVRDSAAEGLGTLMKCVGEKPMQVYLEQVEKTREAKVREFYEKAEIKSVKGTKKSKSKPTTQPVAIRGGGGASKINKAVGNSIKPNLKKKGTVTPKSTSPVAVKPVARSNAMAIDNDVSMSVESLTMTEEEAETQAKALFGESTIDDLQAKVWKVRLAATDTLLNEIKEKNSSEINAEIITKLLSVKPGWKESNFQVNTRMYTIFKYLATLPSFNEPIAAISIPKITEKISDLKIKKIAGECLESYIEAIGFQTVLKYMYNTIKETNNPKTIADSFMWINSNLLDFGCDGIDISELTNILKIGFNHSAPACRKNAIAVIATLRMFYGPDIRNFIEDLNPTLLSTIDAEFEKASKRTPPKPTRIQGSSQSQNIASMNQDNMVPEEPVIVKVDISEHLNETLINKLGDSNWRSRKEALDEIEELINNANKHIKPNLGELPVALNHRFNDSNKNLIVKAIDLYSLLVTAVGPPFINHAKLMINSILPLFGDNKVQIRNAALNALNTTMKIMPIDVLIQTISETMTNDQPSFRKEMSNWLNDTLNDLTSNNKPLPDLNNILHVNILYLMDKNNEVRRAAQGSFTYIANELSVDTIKKACTRVRGSSSVVMPLLESIRPGSTIVNSPPKQTTPTVKEIPGLSKARLAGSNKRRSQATPPMGLASKREAVMGSASKPPILTMDNRAKEVRAEKDRGLTKWTLDNPRQELTALLSEQCENHFSSDIKSQLFSNSHYKEKDYLSSLNILTSCLVDRQYATQKWGLSWEENCLRFISVTDLILKYLTLRFCDTNTTVLIKCLDLLDSLFVVLDENGYYLSEYEASCFLPSFINKIGDSKDIIRQRIKNLIKQLCRIYPASRTFNYICEGLKSKNSRVRVECLNELGSLIQRNGLNVCHPNKALPIISNQILDRDANVRNAALNTLVEAYKQVGDNIYKYISNIPERSRQLLDEKLKRLPSYNMYQSKPMTNDMNQMGGNIMNDNRRMQHVDIMPQSPTPMEIDGPSNDNIQKSFQDNHIKKEFSLDIDKLNLPQLSNPVNYSLNNNMNNVSSPMVMENESPMMNNLNRNPLSANSSISNNGFGYENRRSLYDYSSNGIQKDYMMDFITTQIMSGVSSESVDALKQLDPILRNHPEIVIPHINQTINAITFQMKLVFNSDNINAPGLVRLCKHLINVLVLIFSNVELSKIIVKDSLYPLFEEVLKGMLDHNLTKSEAGSQLVRALNILMVRILDNSNRNISFSALLLLLEKSSAILVSMSNESNEKVMLQAKFTELVMKCLWKMTKAIHKMLETQTLEVNQLLLDINNLFIATPPSEWKKRASENFPVGDMPLRTIKTILSELTSSLSDRIFENFDLINDPQKSYVYSYVSHMVQSQKKRNALHNQSTSNPSSGGSSPIMMHQKYNNTQMNMTQSNSNNSISSTNTFNSVNSNSNNNSIQNTNKERENNTNINNSNNNSESELDHRLDYLFEEMRKGNQIKPTIKEIYQIQQTYPEAKSKIDERINNSSPLIRTLVRRGLTTLSESSNENQSSIPTFSHHSDSSSNRLSMMSTRSSDDTTETYKQKLLRLQQMFGYKNENTSNGGTPNLRYSSQLNGSNTSSIPHPSTTSSLPLPNSNVGTSTSVTVAGLKERLERMKQSMNSQYSANNRYSLNGQLK